MSSSIQVSPSIYNSVYARKVRSNFLEEIDAKITADEEISALRCNGFLAKGDLNKYKSFLLKHICCEGNTHRNTLLDIGCGFGGLGKWLSRELNLYLIGVDFSEVAIQEAKANVSHTEINRFHFQVSSFYETSLEEESIAAAISLDSLYLATNPLNALKEISRVLKPNAPLIFTVYLESPKSNQNKSSANYRDWKAMLKSTGFSITHYVNTTECWRIQMRKKHENRWSKQQRIREELGAFAEAELSVSESMLGLNGKSPFIESVLRFEIGAIKGISEDCSVL
jgi:ubiquinone/menaquinone biosynthesis C-methylase UbiE